MILRSGCGGLLFLLATLHHGWALMDYYMEKFATIGPTLMLNSDPKIEVTIFYDVIFKTEGRVGYWELYAKTRGTFFASIWRANRTNNEMKLIGKNEIHVNSTGYFKYKVPKYERITAEPGDFVGIHYPSKDSRPVITWETDNVKGTPGVEDPLSNYKSMIDLYDDDMPIGRTFSLTNNTDKKILPSLCGIIVGLTDNLRLVNGRWEKEGRPEMFKEGAWGTICDKWFHVKGWANLFCFEIGYPGSLRAIYTKDERVATGRPEAEANITQAIRLQSPRCKASLNISMFQCDIHPRGGCGHELDVFIECNPKVRLVGNNCTRRKGVPQIWDDMYWGSICDVRSPHDHMSDPLNSWTNALCIQMGYVGVKNVEKAEDKFDGYHPDYNISLYNPQCDPQNYPTRMESCPGTPRDPTCNHSNDYYITCEGEDEDEDLDNPSNLSV